MVCHPFWHFKPVIYLFYLADLKIRERFQLVHRLLGVADGFIPLFRHRVPFFVAVDDPFQLARLNVPPGKYAVSVRSSDRGFEIPQDQVTVTSGKTEFVIVDDIR